MPAIVGGYSKGDEFSDMSGSNQNEEVDERPGQFLPTRGHAGMPEYP